MFRRGYVNTEKVLHRFNGDGLKNTCSGYFWTFELVTVFWALHKDLDLSSCNIAVLRLSSEEMSGGRGLSHICRFLRSVDQLIREFIKEDGRIYNNLVKRSHLFSK